MMSNSPLVSYTKISPNRNSPRNNTIKKITIHHMAGNLTIETCGNVFAAPSRGASSNYGIGSDGRIGMYVEEKDRSWCSSSRDNDNQAITIEVANDGGAPDWHVSDKALSSLIDLCVDICQRNNIERLNFTGDASGNLTQHNYFAATACPGPYLKSKFSYIADEVNKRLSGDSPEVSDGFQASSLTEKSESEIVELVGPLFTKDQEKTGILASVSMAQFIFESSYGKSELAVNANNCFGMKKSLSGNTWSGSTWDGSIYLKETKEYSNGQYITIVSEFRKYKCVEDSIEDHSAYLAGAMNGSKKRYEGLVGETDYREAATIIKNGGYATSPTYIDSLCNVIEKWNLTRFDSSYNLEDKPSTEYPDVPFTVNVIVNDLNYRSKPSMSGKVNGQTGKGIFTIVEVSGDWGKLKSGVGWIYLANPEYLNFNASNPSNPPESVYPETPFTVKFENSFNYYEKPDSNSKVNGTSGKGIFTIVELFGDWGKLKSGVGWVKLSASEIEENDEYSVPFLVKVEISALNIRKGPGTNYEVSSITGKGVFTIVEVQKGPGSNNGWGKLKSGAGWISLDYVTKE